MIETWHKQIELLFDQMVEWRRYMHKYPELSFQEVKTAEMIGDILEGYGMEIIRNVGGHGVVAKIYGKYPGTTIALRADFDALPIQDEKTSDYKSTVDGVMHACGHDGHTSTLLAVSKVLNDNVEDLYGNVVLIFQHAEEQPPGGAIKMIEAGCLDGVDVIFGGHLAAQAPLGTFLYHPEYSMAAGDLFEITIKGKGGHGSAPHQTIDPIVIGAEIIGALQHIVSRQIDPQKAAVLSVGSFQGGNAPNVIPDSAKIAGTVRYFEEEVGVQLEDEIKNIVEHICSAYRANYDIVYPKGYPAVYNHKNETNIFLEAVEQTLKENQLVKMTPVMGGEDFARYLQHRPGMFFHIGAKKDNIEESYPHHHPKFDFNETAMLHAGKAFLSIIDYYQKVSKDNNKEAEA